MTACTPEKLKPKGELKDSASDHKQPETNHESNAIADDGS
jgi:hypothetical protein